MRFFLLILIAIAVVKANAMIPTQEIEVSINEHEEGWMAVPYCFGLEDTAAEVFKEKLQELYKKAGALCAPARPAVFKMLTAFKYECTQNDILLTGNGATVFDLELRAQFICEGSKGSL